MKALVGAVVATYSLLVVVRGLLRGLVARRRRGEARSKGADHAPFVSVIVPAWRDAAALEACLRSLARVDYPHYEAIIVAGGPDGTYETACAAAQKDPRLRVIEQLPRGKNAALNQGLAAAGADVVVLLDADSQLSPQWLRELVGALQGDVAASTGNYLPMRETPVSLYGDLAKVHEYEVREHVILQGSGGIAVRRGALDVIGPFPEERISSDWDLNARLALQGFRRVFAPGAIVQSHRPLTLGEWWRNELRWRRLHLRSLFRLKKGLLSNPGPTARHLYPYVTSWMVALTTAIAAGSLVTGSEGFKKLALPGWVGATSLLMARELGPVVSVIAYAPSRRWLRVIPVVPVLTAMTWVACCVASLTRNKAALQFKGARHTPAVPRSGSNPTS